VLVIARYEAIFWIDEKVFEILRLSLKDCFVPRNDKVHRFKIEKMKNHILLFMCLAVITALCYVLAIVAADGVPKDSIIQLIIAKFALIIYLIFSFPTYYLVTYYGMSYDILPYVTALNLIIYTFLLPKIYSFIKLKLQNGK
jgi:hypothetical protein